MRNHIGIALTGLLFLGTLPNASGNGSALTMFQTAAAQTWSYEDANGHIWQIVYSNGSWGYMDVTAAANAPVTTLSSGLTMFQTAESSQTWSYDPNGHIWQIVYSNGGWGYMDVTAAANAPVVALGSGLTMFQTAASQIWSYEDANGHIWQIVYSNGSWGYMDVTAAANAPVATLSGGLTMFQAAASSQTWSYQDANGHIWQIINSNGSWGYMDVTAAANAPAATLNGGLTMFEATASSQTWSYEDANGHIWQIVYSNGGWGYMDVTAAANAPVAALSGGLTMFQTAAAQTWSYEDANGHIWQIVYSNGGWGYEDVTAAANAPPAAIMYSVSGQVTAGGTDLPGVTVSLSGTAAVGTSVSLSTTTDSNGNYSFSVPAGGTYTVTPSFGGYTFSPASQTFSNVNATQTMNFVVPTIALQNLTHPNLSPDFAVGDTFQVVIHGGANQPVSVSQTPGTTTQVGATDANGNFTYATVEQTSNIGSYTQIWSVGGVQITPAISFVVGQLGGGTVSTTDIGETPDGHVEGISTISITNGTASAYSVTELDYTAQLYYDAYTVAGIYDNGQLVASGQSSVGAGAEGGSLSATASAWDIYTLQTDHYVVAFLLYGDYYQNPLYYEGYASGEDSSGDLTFGSGGGAFYIVEAPLYLGSTIADQLYVPQDGNNIPLPDDSVFNSFVDSVPQPQQPNIQLKVDVWNSSIRSIITGLFIYESAEASQGQTRTYPLPMILQLTQDCWSDGSNCLSQPSNSLVERDRTYLVRDSNGIRWQPYNPLTIFETLNYVAGPGALPSITNDPDLTQHPDGWNTANGEIDASSQMRDQYAAPGAAPGASGEVDYWQQYWATGFNAPGLALPGIQVPGYPGNAIPLMILSVNNNIPGACRYYGTQGVTLRTDYVGINGDHGPNGTCPW